MARSNFINPLLRRTDAAPEGAQPPLLEVAAEPAGPAVGPAATPAPAAATPLPAPPVAQPPAPEAANEAPVKFTFYFMPEQLRRLDDLWLRTKLAHRERLNKSEFVRLALDRLMDAYDNEPQGVLEALRRQRTPGGGE
jgi:hypothetical protein